ncbi:hypothetical protein GJ698_01095 [Pseudoduganella sp. FT26W]|uniref:Uncharacterized protein n=1 Tax=Duganella aquatilis TaxID=2666082 RepID=A0A844CYX2_9BURK|nr:hypothetical protein [Duganella aquatilis]MRW82685.1 hypothetical protein [Duganella aquatilis]
MTPRSDAQQASIIREGLEWSRTYGQRSAAAFLLFRKVPRAVVERILTAACRREDQAP